MTHEAIRGYLYTIWQTRSKTNWVVIVWPPVAKTSCDIGPALLLSCLRLTWLLASDCLPHMLLATSTPLIFKFPVMAIRSETQWWRADRKAEVCEAVQDPGLSVFCTHAAMLHGSRTEIL